MLVCACFRYLTIPNVTSTHDRTDGFPIKVGLYQGSGLSPFLFIVVLYVISEQFRFVLPSELLFADDLAVVTYTEEEMQRSCKQGTESQYRENFDLI